MLSSGVALVIVSLAVLVKLRLVKDRKTDRHTMTAHITSRIKIILIMRGLLSIAVMSTSLCYLEVTSDD